jgi:predicted nucleic acid-binding protein
MRRVIVNSKNDSACVQIQSAGEWIHVKEIQDCSEKKMYKAKLHAGEVEGVLVKAKHQKIIEEVRPLLSEMRKNGFYVDEGVEQIVLAQAGEL